MPRRQIKIPDGRCDRDESAALVGAAANAAADF